MTRTLRLLVAATAITALFATAPAAAQTPGSTLVVTAGPIANGTMQAVGHPPDYDAGCSTRDFTALLVIETVTGSALGTVQGACGVLATSLPSGSCKSNLPARPGFTCSHKAGGWTRTAFTSSSQPTRDFGFSELSTHVWFQVAGSGVGAG